MRYKKCQNERKLSRENILHQYCLKAISLDAYDNSSSNSANDDQGAAPFEINNSNNNEMMSHLDGIRRRFCSSVTTQRNSIGGAAYCRHF